MVNLFLGRSATVAFILLFGAPHAQATSYSLLKALSPANQTASDGVTTNYELGMEFQSSQPGAITAIRFYKSSSESGIHTGHIFSMNGSILASVQFKNETASGWQQQAFSTSVKISAGQKVVVSVNSGNTFFVDSQNGLARTITSGPLSTIVGSNGLYGDVGQFPTSSYSHSNYFRDVVFVTTTSPTPTPKPTPVPTAAPTATPPVSNTTGLPHLNYSDLVSGSGSGNDNGNGAYVTLYGSKLSTSGSITLGGKPVLTNCSNCSWTNQKIVFQVGGNAVTGDIVLTNSSGTSNGLPFTVAPTHYYFISPNGSDVGLGTYAVPYKTLRHFLDTNAPISQNTIVYFLNGVNLVGDDGRGWNTSAALDSGGISQTVRLNLVAFPGAIANIGSPNDSAQFGMKTYSDYVTIAGLNLRGYSAFNGYPSTGYIRFIGNDVSCQNVPAAFGDNACLEFASGSSSGQSAVQTLMLGNTVHDTGSGVADKTYHAVYFSTDMNRSEIAWNTIGSGVFYGYGRSILLHSSPNGNPGAGRNQYGYEIHDNFIQKGWNDGIGLASVDPSKGAINIYNNVIVNTGTTSDRSSNQPPDGNNTAISLSTDADGPSSGAVNVYNNTIYAGGVFAAYSTNGCFGIVATGATFNLNNNICYQPNPSMPYLETAAGGAISGGYSGSHNLWFGNGGVPAWDVGGVNVNPELSNPVNYKSAADFTVGLSISPAVGAQIN